MTTTQMLQIIAASQGLVFLLLLVVLKICIDLKAAFSGLQMWAKSHEKSDDERHEVVTAKLRNMERTLNQHLQKHGG